MAVDVHLFASGVPEEWACLLHLGVHGRAGHGRWNHRVTACTDRSVPAPPPGTTVPVPRPCPAGTASTTAGAVPTWSTVAPRSRTHAPCPGGGGYFKRTRPGSPWPRRPPTRPRDLAKIVVRQAHARPCHDAPKARCGGSGRGLVMPSGRRYRRTVSRRSSPRVGTPGRQPHATYGPSSVTPTRFRTVQRAAPARASEGGEPWLKPCQEEGALECGLMSKKSRRPLPIIIVGGLVAAIVIYRKIKGSSSSTAATTAQAPTPRVPDFGHDAGTSDGSGGGWSGGGGSTGAVGRRLRPRSEQRFLVSFGTDRHIADEVGSLVNQAARFPYPTCPKPTAQTSSTR